VSRISPGFTSTELTHRGGSEQAQAAATESLPIRPRPSQKPIGYAIDRPGNVDVNAIVVRPTVQGTIGHVREQAGSVA
jgi:NADP-dependent 3-hydroxy acid dehydrogenase YdfG